MHAHTRASDEGIGNAYEKSLEMIIKQVRLEGSLKEEAESEWRHFNCSKQMLMQSYPSKYSSFVRPCRFLCGITHFVFYRFFCLCLYSPVNYNVDVNIRVKKNSSCDKKNCNSGLFMTHVNFILKDDPETLSLIKPGRQNVACLPNQLFLPSTSEH